MPRHLDELHDAARACDPLLMRRLDPENLRHIPWKSAESVIAAAECFLDFAEARLPPGESHRRVQDLVKHAALRFARQRRLDEAFELLSSVRVHLDPDDPDLFRLHNALLRHEHKRVARRRRRLLWLLATVLAYLFFVSPTVFVRLENPHRVANAMGMLDWSEGLYWSVITSTTVGYGDIVPYTPYGRLFGLFNAMLGVLLMGVVAGLILSTLSPRRLLC
jgi:hypothetical protein